MNKSETRLVKFNVHDPTAGLNDDWKNFVVSEVNDHVVRLSLLQRDFHWHSQAQLAFLDRNRVILEDLDHSDDEKRYYCLGKVAGGIMTVRFTYRRKKIRIIGAGYWRKGKKIYERENKIHG